MADPNPVSETMRAARQLAETLDRLGSAREDAKVGAREWRAVIDSLEKRVRDLARAIRTGEFQPGLFDPDDPADG